MNQKINSSKQKLALDRLNADQGEFFFAKARMSNGEIIPRPVFIIGKKNDSNDVSDVIVCSCTTEPARTSYDVKVQLKHETMVRTNKIYTIDRGQLVFKIKHQIDSAEIKKIIKEANRAIN